MQPDLNGSDLEALLRTAATRKGEVNEMSEYSKVWAGSYDALVGDVYSETLSNPKNARVTALVSIALSCGL